jgi:sugar/nucleoside kinase (ribokinase family)
MMDVTVRIDSDIVYASDTPARVSLQPGGSGANTSAWMGAAGRPVTFIGAVGADAFGDVIVEHLRSFGVDCRMHRSAEHATGSCVVIVDGSGERTMFPDAGANSSLTETVVRTHLEDDFDHVHLTGYTLLNEGSRAAGLAVLDTARARGITASLDTSSAGPLEACRELIREQLTHVDVLLANGAEAAVLVGTDDPHSAVDTLLEFVPIVVIKLGPRGVVGASRDERVELAAIDVRVVDTTGAGDAFSAGFLPAWLAGAPLAEALSAAVATSARAVGRVGAGPPTS